MPLSDLAIRRAKPKSSTYTLADGEGMYLEISPQGGKWWRFKYRFQGKQKRLSLGTYPRTSLKEARDKRAQLREQLLNGIDPAEMRKSTVLMAETAASNSFEVIAREWFLKKSKTWVPSHADKIIRRLERDIFPWLGSKPITSITTPELLKTLTRIENRGSIETAHRALQNCGQVFRYAVITGRAENDPTTSLKGALTPVKKTHLAAIIEPKAIGDLLRAMDSYEGTLVTKSALRLAPLVIVRPGELRKAEWSEINLGAGEWNIPAERMKMRVAHLVPLSTQAVEILTELRALTGNGRYVFPSARSRLRPMSDNAILAALRRMGYSKDEMTGHGFRAMARTVMDEILQIRPDYIEQQLAHAVRDPNGRAYNRTSYLPQRRDMMQRWADYLDGLKQGAVIVPFRRGNN